MTSGILPVPKAAGPVAGAPGHFGHHDWLEAAVQALDERLIKQIAAVTVVTQLPANVYTPIKYDTALFDSGLDIAITPSGGVTLGPGAPEGYYRLDVATAHPKGAGTTAGDRRQRLLVNTVEAGPWYVACPGSTNSATTIVKSGIIWLPAAAIVVATLWHNTGATIDTATGSQCSMTFEFMGPGTESGDTGQAAPEADEIVADTRPETFVGYTP